MTKYILPNFEDYTPQFIDLSIKKIEKSHLYNATYSHNPDNKKFEQALFNLKNLKEIVDLSKRDIKILSHHLISLENIGLFDEYYKVLTTRINDIRNKSYFIRPLLNYLYNESKNKSKVYGLLKILGEHITKRKERYNYILDLFIESNNFYEFLQNLKTKFSMANKKEDVDNLCEKYLIKQTDEVYGECIINFIYNNYLNDNLWSYNKNSIIIMKLELKKKIFKKILLKYKDNANTEEYPKNWFNFIYNELGDPYDPANVRWGGLEDVKEIFRRWNVDENIEKFFEQIVGGDKRRKKFWKKYINNIYRIEYFEEASKALVMEFKDHLFVEFAKKNNACYFYDKKTMNINDIRSQIKDSGLSKTRKLKFLKQLDKAKTKKNHIGYWEYKFDYIISNLGYKKSRWS